MKVFAYLLSVIVGTAYFIQSLQYLKDLVSHEEKMEQAWNLAVKAHPKLAAAVEFDPTPSRSPASTWQEPLPVNLQRKSK